MPIFEYRCEDCGHRFDAFFRHAEDAETEELICAKCGSGKVRKLFSVIGLGSTDSRSTSDGCGTRST
jgi:putative FmdB family regulatory protein